MAADEAMATSKCPHYEADPEDLRKMDKMAIEWREMQDMSDDEWAEYDKWVEELHAAEPYQQIVDCGPCCNHMCTMDTGISGKRIIYCSETGGVLYCLGEG